MAITLSRSTSVESFHSASDHSNECAICLQPKTEVYTLSCGHDFHIKCLDKLARKALAKCPLCRTNFDREDLLTFKSRTASHIVTIDTPQTSQSPSRSSETGNCIAVAGPVCCVPLFFVGICGSLIALFISQQNSRNYSEQHTTPTPMPLRMNTTQSPFNLSATSFEMNTTQFLANLSTTSNEMNATQLDSTHPKFE